MSTTTRNFDLEVDLLLTHYGDRPLKTAVALEVDGPYHYPRNSQETTGQYVLKHKILRTREGLQVLQLPYFDLLILEDKQRTSYVLDCLQNLCSLETD